MISPHDEPRVTGIVEDALDRIRNLLYTLFETAEDAVFLMDGQRFVDCNPATLRMFGCDAKADIIGQTPLQFSPIVQPDGRSSAELVSRYIAAACAGVTQNFEWRHCRLDHSGFDVEVKLNRFLVGDSPFLVAVVRDITERKRYEAELRRQHLADELVNRILSRCAGCTVDRFNTHMVSSLQELSRFLGVDHAYFFVISPDRTSYRCTHEAHGPRIAPLCPQVQNRSWADTWIERALLAGEWVRIDSLKDHPEAEMLQHRVSSLDVGCRSLLLVPTSGPSGQSAGAMGVDSHTRQVTWTDNDVLLCRIVGNALTGMFERNQAEHQLQQEKQFSERLAAEVQAASSAKDQFLAVLSHELRNPLAAIQSGIGLLRRVSAFDEPRMRRTVEIIERNSRLLARLVDDLLDLSRLVRGKLTIRRAPVRLEDIVLSAVETCRADAARAGIALETHAESGLWIEADSDRIQQIVINLVDNGIKFTPKGGRVTVSVVEKDSRGRIIVEDTGIGIDEDRLPELFQMFRQGEVAARRAAGLGIGLALVAAIAELHGGHVWAESAGPGQGSRFIVALPLRAPP